MKKFHPFSGARAPLFGSVAAKVLALCLLTASVIGAENWQTEKGYRWRALTPTGTAGGGFTRLGSEQTGLTFTNRLSDFAAAQNRILENGGGVALGDVDGDGWCDIYLCRTEGPNVLYRNKGDGTFEDITDWAGVACARQYSTGAVLADIDGDGDLDLLVNSIGGGTRAFLNQGDGRFEELEGSRLVRRFGSMSMALADIDGDGDLDLYVTNYRVDTFKDRPAGLNVEARMENGRVVVVPEGRFLPLTAQHGGMQVVERGDRDFLYINDGKGNFLPVSWTSGSFLDEDGKALEEPPQDWGLTVMFRDMNGDMAPDIYVCNDFFYFPDRIWINHPGQGFRAIDRGALRNMSVSSMAIDFADINRNGHDDFFVADMLSRKHSFRQRQRPNTFEGLVTIPFWDPLHRPEVTRNTLQLNRGNATFAEIAQLAGLDATEWSWGVAFLDVDLDGYEDLLVATGNNHDVQDADVLRELSGIREATTPQSRLRNLLKFPRLLTPNLAFRNRGDLTFEDASARWGFNQVGISHGLALADLDNDGDLDLVVNNLHEAVGIYRNDSAAPRLAVRLRGLPPNTQAIGSKLRIVPVQNSAPGLPVQTQEIISGGRYLSGDDPMRVFAAGSPDALFDIHVSWRSGRTNIIRNARANRVYEITESADDPLRDAPSTPAPSAQFEDISARLNHFHSDTLFDDWERQPLLTHRLSALGPGVAWHDLDHDGWDDLIIGTGAGGRPAAFRNERGTFHPMEELFPSSATPQSRDQTGLAAFRQGARSSVLFGISNYEDGGREGAAVERIRSGEAAAGLPGEAMATGPLALADIDGDGDLDLFVGGRSVPGHFPRPAGSRIYRNENGTFVLDEINTPLFENAGLVSGALFTDYNNDGWPDLVLACHWGPLRLFKNERGRFVEVTEAAGLSGLHGWWNSVVAGDFNGDGLMDLAAGNWGRNTPFQKHLAQPLRSYFGDFSEDGSTVGVETNFDSEIGGQVPWRSYETMRRALPGLAERLHTFREYGLANIEQVLGERMEHARQLRTDTLDSMIFLNRGGRFEAVPLPAEAQFAPVFGMAAADFDGDGRDDLFLAQNFFGVDREISRSDAGLGLWLRGNGKGQFEAQSATASGIEILGEQRGCAVADFDQDGRMDLVVAQNSGQTRLFRNRLATPGLRIRLEGSADNPDAIGAVLRMVRGNELSAAREQHAGSGYWSQNSAVVVMNAQGADHLWIRWPGERVTRSPLPPGAREISVDREGKVRLLR